MRSHVQQCAVGMLSVSDNQLNVRCRQSQSAQEPDYDGDELVERAQARVLFVFNINF